MNEITWTLEHEALKNRAIALGYFYWDKKESGGGIVRADHCIYDKTGREIVARSYGEAWAWIYAFRALGWIDDEASR